MFLNPLKTVIPQLIRVSNRGEKISSHQRNEKLWFPGREITISTLLAKFPLGFRNKKIALGVTSKACNSTKEQWGHCSPFNFFLIVGGKKFLFLIVGGKKFLFLMVGGKNILFPHSPHCQLLAMSCPIKGDPKLKLFYNLVNNCIHVSYSGSIYFDSSPLYIQCIGLIVFKWSAPCNSKPAYWMWLYLVNNYPLKLQVFEYWCRLDDVATSVSRQMNYSS